MANIDVRRVRDALVSASVTDEASGLELSTSMEDDLSATLASQERLETLEERLESRLERIDARLEMVALANRAEIRTRFAQARVDGERRANRDTAIALTALAASGGGLGILIAVL